MSRSTRMILLMFAFAALTALCVRTRVGAIQSDLQSRARAALDRADMHWATVVMVGREAMVSGTAPTTDAGREAAVAVAAVDGVRTVVNHLKVGRPPGPGGAPE